MTKSDLSVSVVHTDGEFRVVVIAEGTRHAHYCIHHACSKKQAHLRSWWYFCSHPDMRYSHCPVCRTSPPEGLQMCFWFLKEEEYSK